MPNYYIMLNYGHYRYDTESYLVAWVRTVTKLDVQYSISLSISFLQNSPLVSQSMNSMLIIY